MEIDYRHLFEAKKMGTTIWSPLASGILTGKYNNGELIDNSRFTNNPELVSIFKRYFTDKKDQTIEALKKFEQLAKELDCTMAQLAIAWAINNPDVSTAITGASHPDQLVDTLKGISVRRKLTPEI